MNKLKIFRLSITIFQLLVFTLFAFSLHALFSVLSTTLSDNNLFLELNVDESSRDWLFTLKANPVNNGYLGVNISLELGILNFDDQHVAYNSTSVYVKRGNSQPFYLTLKIPSEKVERYGLEENEGFMRTTLSIKTFGNLIGFTNILDVGGRGRDI